MRASRAMLPVLCGVLALHNAMRIGPVTFVEEWRGRYGIDYGTLLDRGLGLGAVWGLATALGALRVLAILGIREPPRPPSSQP